MLLCIALGVACSASRSVRPSQLPEEPPAWKTEEGRYQARIDLVEVLVETDAIPVAMDLLRVLREEGYTNPEIDILHARGLMRQGLHSEAERMLDEVRSRAPRDPRINRYLSLIYADSERLDLAIEELQRATRLEPGHAASWNNLGFLLLSVQRYEQALAALQEAVSLDGSNVRFRNNLGFALAANNRPSEALAAFRGTGSNADAHANLALALELGGEPSEASQHYKRALTYDPEHELAHQGLDRLATTSPPPQETP